MQRAWNPMPGVTHVKAQVYAVAVNMNGFHIDKIAMGSLPRLERLVLNGNSIGDAGLTAFADMCRTSGNMSKLTLIYLQSNQIGDAGMIALTEALKSGTLPVVQDVLLFGNLGKGAPIKKALSERKLCK